MEVEYDFSNAEKFIRRRERRSMVFLTGDKHGEFERVKRFCLRRGTTTNDVLVILGDVGLNFYKGEKDRKRKENVNSFPITTFCIHGNHEIRPQNISSYVEKEYRGGKVLIEPEFPNILFAIDGEVYGFDGQKCLVIGGAYSVDKGYRLLRGYGWWPDEQPDDNVKKKVEEKIKILGGKVDRVFSHTCPLKYVPRETFLPKIDQKSVDASTEEWLDKIENELQYDGWYCGHYHTDKTIDKIKFMYDDFVSF